MNAQELNAELRKMREKYSGVDVVIPRILCADGFSFSVQASGYHYCSPRESYRNSYHEVEVGYPTSREEALMPYAEDVESPTDSVYGYVPVDIVAQIITAHGGIAEERVNV